MTEPIVLEERINLGISACNFGARVRYNRKGWDRLDDLGRERLEYTWTPVCPEVASGLGVPRPAMRLAGGSGAEAWEGQARVKTRYGADVTAALCQGCTLCLETLELARIHAFVFQEGSPSCGVYRTSLRGRRMGHPPGVFGALLLEHDFFLIPAEDLQSPVKWWDWRRRLHAFLWLAEQELTSKGQVYELWNRFKFVCQEIDEPRARAIGRELAAWPKRFPKTQAVAWKREVLHLLRRPSTYRRILGWMAKHTAHYRRELGLSTDEVKLPRDNVGKRVFITALEKLERQARQQGYAFAGAPVGYSPPR